MAVENRSGELPFDGSLTYPPGTIGKYLADLSLSVGTATVPDGSITSAKLAADAVTTSKILTGNVTTSKLAANAVTLAKLVAATATGKWLVRTSAGAGNFEEGDSTAYGRSLINVADEAALKALINAEAGVDFQAYDADLAAIAALTSAANKGIYATGAGTWATFDLSAAGRTLAGSGESKDLVLSTNFQTGTTYTIVTGDSGKLVDYTNASAITVTLPATFPVGFNCDWSQGGAGQITFSPASGATLVNRQSHTRSFGRYAGGSLFVRANSGDSAAVWQLFGDTAA